MQDIDSQTTPQDEPAVHHGPLHVTDADFATEVDAFKGIVLVDFWATWCAPCLKIAPHVESLVERYADRPEVKITKLNVDENQETSEKYGIRSIPSLLVFKDGVVVETTVGLQTADSLAKYIDKYLTPAETATA